MSVSIFSSGVKGIAGGSFFVGVAPTEGAGEP